MHSIAAVTSGQIDNEMFVGATAQNTSKSNGPPGICLIAQMASPPLLFVICCNRNCDSSIYFD
jgi:hypothetical protein